jgi:iron(III) transport system permease protein
VLLPLSLRAAAVLTALVLLVPLGFVLIFTFITGWSTAYELIVRPRVGELLLNTLKLVFTCGVLCGAIGVGAAWLTERTTLPLAGMWRVLLVAPLAVPSFVNGFAWVSMSSRVQEFGGAVLIMTLSHFPFVYLPVMAALRGLDPALEESARSLGTGPVKTFARVVMPQLRPSLFGGVLLVALHLLAELGALEMLRFPTFTTAIYDQFGATVNSQSANALASVLVSLCLLALLAELVLRGRSRYARLGTGSPRPARPLRLGLASAPALALLGVLVVLALGVPIGMLAYWLATGRSTAFPVAMLATTAFNSIRLGLMGAAITVLLALPVAWLAVRRPGLLSTLTERASYIAHALPGIVVALSLVAVTIRFARPAYQTTGLLLVAYVILFFPLALVGIRSALSQVPPTLDSVGRSLGVSPLAVFWRVTLPLISPGLRAGAALVFISIVTELTATLLLSPTGTQTLVTRFWGYSESIMYGAAAPYAALMVIISAPVTYVLTRQALGVRRA